MEYLDKRRGKSVAWLFWAALDEGNEWLLEPCSLEERGTKSLTLQESAGSDLLSVSAGWAQVGQNDFEHGKKESLSFFAMITGQK